MSHLNAVDFLSSVPWLLFQLLTQVTFNWLQLLNPGNWSCFCFLEKVHLNKLKLKKVSLILYSNVAINIYSIYKECLNIIKRKPTMTKRYNIFSKNKGLVLKSKIEIFKLLSGKKRRTVYFVILYSYGWFKKILKSFYEVW